MQKANVKLDVEKTIALLDSGYTYVLAGRQYDMCISFQYSNLRARR